MSFRSSGTSSKRACFPSGVVSAITLSAHHLGGFGCPSHAQLMPSAWCFFGFSHLLCLLFNASAPGSDSKIEGEHDQPLRREVIVPTKHCPWDELLSVGCRDSALVPGCSRFAYPLRLRHSPR